VKTKKSYRNLRAIFQLFVTIACVMVLVLEIRDCLLVMVKKDQFGKMYISPDDDLLLAIFQQNKDLKLTYKGYFI